MQQTLYRTHRPTSFDEILGQDHIVEVLKKSIEKKNVSHAYLFSGSRGTGKTSVARIFAEGLGCDKIDVFEIDAASHTSVENIRDLNESVRTMPVNSKYKIYILDESHMLSKSAFNAFLKTLEEPPEHTIFILATTELEKIPDTVVSRCVNLSFHKPSIQVLRQNVLSVSKKEGYALSEQSASLIALLADGSFRDALGTLQKVILSSGSKKINHVDVERIVGSPSHSLVNDYITSLVSKDIDMGVSALNKAHESSSDMGLFCKLVIRKIRAVLLLREGIDRTDEYDEEDVKFIKSLKDEKELNFDVLSKILDASLSIGRVNIKQLPLEGVLFSLCEGK